MSPTPNNARSRRQILKSVTLVGGASAVIGPAALAALQPTPSQTEGPFYPDLDNDLTFVRAKDKRARGDVIYFHGTVQTTDGQPVERAVVEIWQTDHQGIYDHAGDERQKDKDPNFQSYGRAVTDASGRYSFRSIQPSRYSAGSFTRTPHIHYKVGRRGFHELTTQIYFEGEEHNTKDRLFNSLKPDEQEQLTVAFRPTAEIDAHVRAQLGKDFDESELPANARVGQFTAVLADVTG